MMAVLKTADFNRETVKGVKEKIHPHKFTMWVGIASIVMMFAGLTSAVLVRRNQANWSQLQIPVVFWYSTAVMVLSSITLMLARKSFAEREMAKYRTLLTSTLVLGVLFIILQIIGFYKLIGTGTPLGKTNSVDFLYVIVGLHGVHVIAGVVALVVMFMKAFGTKIKSYSIVPVELMSTYWHFVDLLWIYLLVFLIVIK